MLRSQTSLYVPMSLTQELSSRTNLLFSYKDVVPILHGGGDPYPDHMALLVFFLIFHTCVCVFAMLIVFDVIDIFTSFTFVCLCNCSCASYVYALDFIHFKHSWCFNTWNLFHTFVTLHIFNGVGTPYLHTCSCIFLFTHLTHMCCLDLTPFFVHVL